MRLKTKKYAKLAVTSLIAAFSFGLAISCVSNHKQNINKVFAEESDGTWTLTDGSLKFQYNDWQTNGYVTQTNQTMVHGNGDGTFDISYELLGSPPGATSAGTEYIADKTILLIDGYWTPSETGGYGTVSGFPVDVNGLDSGTMITLNINVQYSGNMNEQGSGEGNDENAGTWSWNENTQKLSFQFSDTAAAGYVSTTSQTMVYGNGNGTFDIGYDLYGTPANATMASNDLLASKTIRLYDGYFNENTATVTGNSSEVAGLESYGQITVKVDVTPSGDLNADGWRVNDGDLYFYVLDEVNPASIDSITWNNSSGNGTGEAILSVTISTNGGSFQQVYQINNPTFNPELEGTSGTTLGNTTVEGISEWSDRFVTIDISNKSYSLEESTQETRYTITYYPNGADGEPANDFTDQVLEGDTAEYMLLENMFSRPNYIFLGWSTDSSSQTPNYEEGEKVYLRSDISYYAIWEYQETDEIRYTITYYPNGAVGDTFEGYTEFTSGDSSEVSYTFESCPDDYYMEGYYFAGWSSSQGGEEAEFIAGETYLVNQDLHVYAVWVLEEQDPETQAEITSLVLLEDPPTYYDVGDVIDFQNIILVANYSDGTTRELTSNDYVAYLSPEGDPYEPLVSGDYLLYFTYEDVTTESGVPIYVNEREPETYEFEVIFVANDGTSETRTNSFTHYESSYRYDDLPSIEQIGFTREGYSFVGWSYYSDGEVLKEVPVIESGTTTFYAIWESTSPQGTEYIVKFNGNGATSGSMDDDSFTTTIQDYQYSFPYELRACGYSRDGYAFAGWGFTETAVIKWQPGEIKDIEPGETTFYAIWVQIFNITFDANGGTGSMEPISVQSGTTSTVPGCDFVREGYSFAGWAVNSPDSDTIVQPDESVNVNQDYLLYALWESVGPKYQYTVTFDGNGATSGSTDPVILSGDDYSQTIIFPVCGYEREGYIFAGWGFDSEAVITFQPGEERSDITSDTTFYAIWTQLFTISFDANGGEGMMENITIPKGNATMPECSFTREGYSFAGWAVGSPTGDVYPAGESVYVSANYVLFATWEPISPQETEYTVRFNGNGATSGSMDDDSFTSSQEYSYPYILPECGFSRDGYTFAGWGTTETVVIKRQPGETIDIQPGETTFYAIWTQVFTISFDANGGEGMMENITIPAGNATMPECDFTREGYSFAGWAVGSPTGDVYQTGASVYVSMDYTLYATWNVVTPGPEPVYNQYWSYVDQELRWVDEAHPTYLTRVDKVIYSERSLTASVLISILNEKEVVVDTKYISLSNASYELISDGYGSVTGYFNLLIEDDKVIVLNNVVIAVEKIPETPEEKAADVSEEQIAQINSLLPETQDSRVEEVISDLNQGTAYQIVEVATDAKSFIDELRKEGGEGYTEAEYQRDLQTVQSATEAAVVVGAAAKDTNIATQVQEMTKSVPEDTGVNLNGVLKDFYEQQMQYLLGEAVAKKDGEQPTRRITRAEAPKVNKVDVTDFLKQEFDQMLDFVDRSVDDIEDTLLQVRKCSHESVKLAVNQSITTITSKSFRDFDKDKADREFVETLEPVMMATMQSQVLAVLEEEYNNSDHRNKDKDQVILDEIEAVKDIEMFRIMVMEVLRQKYESLDGSKSYEDDLEKFTEEIYWPCFEAWALDKDSPVGFTFEELTKATIESSSKRANSYVIATSADKPEIVFISVFAGVTALAIAGAIAVPTVLKKKRRGLAE